MSVEEFRVSGWSPGLLLVLSGAVPWCRGGHLFRVQGLRFRGLGFRGLGFRGLGFRGLGVFRVGLLVLVVVVLVSAPCE